MEQLARRTAQLAFDSRPRRPAFERRQAVLQVREVGRQLLAQEVGAGREELAQLDEARPQIGECARQFLSGPALGAAPVDAPYQPQDTGRNAQLLERAEHVVAGQGARDHQQAQQRAERTKHGGYSRQPEWSAAIPPDRLR